MINKYFTLMGRIEQELSEIKKRVERATRAWDKARELGDFLYLDSVALNLHDFYSGLERIFERIAEDIDELKPSGNSWHQELLKQMATEIPRVRPAVISGNLLQTLDEYRAFRHIVRNVYAHNFKMDRIQKLVENAEEVFKEAEEELHGFCEFLKKLHIN